MRELCRCQSWGIAIPMVLIPTSHPQGARPAFCSCLCLNPRTMVQTQSLPSPLCWYLSFVGRAAGANIPILSGNRGTLNPFAGTQVKINTLLTGFLLRIGFGSVFRDTGVPVAAALASAELVPGLCSPPCHWSPATRKAAGLSQ